LFGSVELSVANEERSRWSGWHVLPRGGSLARPPASPALAWRSFGAPPSQEPDEVAPPSAPRVASEAVGVLAPLGTRLRRAPGRISLQARTRSAPAS